ncbi:hypothetical protein JTB14_002921 [Gonioctena quinquepunctata]|nr:hypothetical protein JTB14_002921 [Gonioctena quinquepunctata]
MLAQTERKRLSNANADEEDQSSDYIQINYEETPDKLKELMEIITKLKNENIHLWKINEEKELLLNEKDKNIKFLSQENERIQQNYNLIVSNIVEKDTIMDSLQKIEEELREMKKKNTEKVIQNDVMSR